MRAARPPRLVRAAIAALLLATSGCATGGGAGSSGSRGSVTPALVDSVTIAMWRFDETSGARVADSGPLRIDGRAGIDTRPDFGRLRNGRLFTRSIDSFVFMDYRPPLDPQVAFTVEAWLYPAAWGQYEIAPLVGRWTQRPGEQSWLLGLAGLNMSPTFAAVPGPDFLKALVHRAGPGFAVFAFLPRDAGSLRTFSSATTIPLGRWTHVAVTYDGEIVRFFINGRQDSQYASAGRIRSSQAPLIAGNYFDWRALSEFGGDLRVEQGDKNPYYAFEGTLDEVRISSVARTAFPHARD